MGLPATINADDALEMASFVQEPPTPAGMNNGPRCKMRIARTNVRELSSQRCSARALSRCGKLRRKMRFCPVIDSVMAVIYFSARNCD